MKLIVAMIAAVFCTTGFAQGTAPSDDAKASKEQTRKAKQEMVKQATEGTYKPSGAPPSKAHAPTTAKKLTKEEKKKAMEGISKTAGSQAGPSAAAQAAKIDPNAPNVAKPDMDDPKVREAMQKQKR